MPKRVLRHEETGKEYEVVEVDREHGTLTLRGPLADFKEPLDWDRFHALGYKRKTIDSGATSEGE